MATAPSTPTGEHPRGDGRRRIVFLDVDGTILEHGSHVAPSTGEAVRSARAAGHEVYLSTGRSAFDIHPRVAEIGFDGAITNSGALVTAGDTVIADRPLSPAATDRMLAVLRTHGIRFFLQTHDGVYASDDMAELMASYAQELRDRDATRGLRPEDSLAGLADRQFPGIEEADLSRIAKAVFVSDHADGLDVLRAELGDEFLIVPGSIPLPGGSNGEIGERGTNKGTAIELLLAHLGRDAADAVAIGDSWNDVEMFEVCGTSVAMGNAHDELKHMADFVTTAVLDDGVWNAFDRLGLL